MRPRPSRTFLLLLLLLLLPCHSSVLVRAALYSRRIERSPRLIKPVFSFALSTKSSCSIITANNVVPLPQRRNSLTSRMHNSASAILFRDLRISLPSIADQSPLLRRGRISFALCSSSTSSTLVSRFSRFNAQKRWRLTCVRLI